MKVRKDAKIGRIRREEREREQERAQVKRGVSSEEQRVKEMQSSSRKKRLKKGHQQREANYKGSPKEEGLSRVLSGYSLTLRPRKNSNFLFSFLPIVF